MANRAHCGDANEIACEEARDKAVDRSDDVEKYLRRQQLPNLQ